MYHSKIPRCIPKTKTEAIFCTDKFSRSTHRVLQSVSKVLTATLIRDAMGTVIWNAVRTLTLKPSLQSWNFSMQSKLAFLFYIFRCKYWNARQNPLCRFSHVLSHMVTCPLMNWILIFTIDYFLAPCDPSWSFDILSLVLSGYAG